MQNTLVKIPIVLGDDRPWSSRSNLTSNFKFTPFWACPHHNSSSVEARINKLDQRCKTPWLRSLLFWGLMLIFISILILQPYFSTKLICAIFVLYLVRPSLVDTVGTPYNTVPYITGSNIARLGHGSQNSWSKLWIPVVKSAPTRVIFAWKSVPKKRIHGSSNIYLGTQWKQRQDSPWSYRLDVIVTFLWYDTISTIWHRDHQSTAKKI